MELTAGSCIRFGWETFKKRSWFFVGVTVLYYFVAWAMSYLSGLVDGAVAAGGQSVAGHVLGFLISYGLATFLGLLLVTFLLKAHDDAEHVQVSDAWRQALRYAPFLLASILLFIIVMGGLILLIVPGIIFSIMFGFASYLVVDRGLNPTEALRESRRITSGHKWMLFRLTLLSFLVILLGFVCLFVGLLVAIPVVWLAGVHAYRALSAKAGEPAPSAAHA